MRRCFSFLKRDIHLGHSSSSSSPLSQDTTSLASILRSAQCAEIFRSSYFSSIKQDNRHISISIADLDELVMENRTRPSLLLPVVECGGMALGVLSNIIPTNIARQMDESVNEGVVQCLNDSVRDEIAIKASASDQNIDVRETLKFHRDLSQQMNINEEQKAGSNRYEFIAQGIYHMLKISRQY